MTAHFVQRPHLHRRPADVGAHNTRELDKLTWRDGLLLDLCQAAAPIPGVSRSGATISGGLLLSGVLTPL